MKRKQRKALDIAQWLPEARTWYNRGMTCAVLGEAVDISGQAVNALLHRHYPKMKFRPRGRRKAP